MCNRKSVKVENSGTELNFFRIFTNTVLGRLKLGVYGCCSTCSLVCFGEDREEMLGALNQTVQSWNFRISWNVYPFIQSWLCILLEYIATVWRALITPVWVKVVFNFPTTVLDVNFYDNHTPSAYQHTLCYQIEDFCMFPHISRSLFVQGTAVYSMRCWMLLHIIPASWQLIRQSWCENWTAHVDRCSREWYYLSNS